MEPRHRSPLRVLAPLALVVFALLFVVVIATSGGGAAAEAAGAAPASASRASRAPSTHRRGAGIYLSLIRWPATSENWSSPGFSSSRRSTGTPVSSAMPPSVSPRLTM